MKHLEKGTIEQDIHDILVPGLLIPLGSSCLMVTFALKSAATDFGTGYTYSELLFQTKCTFLVPGAWILIPQW